MFLTSNGIEYYDIIRDPWYRASIPGDTIYTQFTPDEGGEQMVYQPEEAASPMGCVKQYQFCNPSLSSNKCGPLASWGDAQTEAAPLFGITREDWENGTMPTTSNAMGSRFLWLLTALTYGSVETGNIITHLGQNALTSIKDLSNGLMGPLPTDQWQIDVRYWWATHLASLQAAVVNTAYGQTDPALTPYKVLPFNPHAHSICNNQVSYLPVRACGLELT